MLDNTDPGVQFSEFVMSLPRTERLVWCRWVKMWVAYHVCVRRSLAERFSVN